MKRVIEMCRTVTFQKLDIFDGDLSESTTDLVIGGSEALMLGAGALSHLRDFRLLRVRGARLVVLRRGAAHDLNVVNAYIEIDSCDVLRVEERAFSNIRGTYHRLLLLRGEYTYLYFAFYSTCSMKYFL